MPLWSLSGRPQGLTSENPTFPGAKALLPTLLPANNKAWQGDSGKPAPRRHGTPQMGNLGSTALDSPDKLSSKLQDVLKFFHPAFLPFFLLSFFEVRPPSRSDGPTSLYPLHLLWEAFSLRSLLCIYSILGSTSWKTPIHSPTKRILYSQWKF